jgi:hypothetical protein
MRFRGTTIRRKIVALLLIPLVSLTVVWAYAATVTGQEVWQLVQAERAITRVGHPVEDSIHAIQQERRAALLFLSDPSRSDARTNLHQLQKVTDKDLKQLRTNASSSDNRSTMTDDSLRRLDLLLAEFDGLDALRRTVDDDGISRSVAYDSYNSMVDPGYDFLDSLNRLDDSQIDKQSRALIAVSRGREAISREDSLMTGAIVSGHMSDSEMLSFTFAVAEQRAYYQDSLKLVTPDERALYDAFWVSDDGRALRSAENDLIASGATGSPRVADGAHWQTTVTGGLNDLLQLDNKAADLHDKQDRSYDIRVLSTAGAVGGLGLLAVIATLVISVRIGRSLIRDLSRLRTEAQEVSGTRLPRVMRRLAAGEEVDVETEAPRLDYSGDEVGQVGQALNTLQRAAVEAAVRQARMRRGVSEVFVNLARRSQVLLHRQLTLLDDMERRTEEPQELADLFRLDHMTTRMRRHAEGLVILSGAVPSRQWRNPVQLMDVVRAAVAEVEDYERVEVRRLARVAVAGPAVADVTHLVAELIENATVFSPPHTMVQVHGETVANGFALEIDDRGLGLTPDAMLEANLRLAETPEFELSDTDRLGLFVVSRLAQRQGVRVSLKPSPYGGTTAVVLIPSNLLTDGADDSSGPRTGEFELDGLVEDPPGSEHSFRQWGLAPGHGEEPREHRPFPAEPVTAAAAAADAPDALPRRRRAPVLVADNGRQVTGQQRTPSSTGGLPRRVRQASLAPQLRADTPTGETARPGAPTGAVPMRERSPDEVRARMASLQRGWERGRTSGDTDDAQQAELGDSASRTTTEGNGP